ncbi:MAG: M23 family metallopeptidase [Methyloprofundus sp.]|nr:M23 family metallopeptidase [Methyloprofundus sp.]MBW6452933.1 M23 family metallopeptidase [Methyloprofundus sp.]
MFGEKSSKLSLINSVIFTACLLFSLSCEAKKLYKFQDANGRWHYTDKAPSAQQVVDIQVEVRQLKVEPKQRVWLKQVGKKGSPEFVIRNDYAGPIEVEVTLFEQVNVQAKPQLPSKFVVQPGTSTPLFGLGAVNEHQRWQYSLKYRYALGEPLVKHSQQAIYYPPFVSYKAFRISQAFDGKFSHTDEQNKYAVDFSMPEGSEVHAARAGVVMSLENDFFQGGIDQQAYKARANSVRILHDDGSMGVYAHLQVERAQVHEGMRVKAGQLIAYSGNTGFSSGPHLHFAVQVNQGMHLVSVPFSFVDAQGFVSEPKLGQWLAGFAVDQ